MVTGDKIIVEYYDHFNAQDDLQESLTQTQMGFYVHDTEDYLYLSLSKHTYDRTQIRWEEKVGIRKCDITKIIMLVTLPHGKVVG